MRATPAVVALGLVVLVGGAFRLGASVARAGDEKDAGAMRPVAKLTHPFFKALEGSFTTVSKSTCGEGKGKATCRFAVGETAFVEEYQNGDGEQAFHGIGLYKVSDDGKTVSTWWLDSMSKEPQKFEGPLADDGFEAHGTTPRGPATVAFKKRGEGFDFTLTMNGVVELTEVWTRAK